MPDDISRAITASADILVSGDACRIMLHLARNDLHRLDTILAGGAVGAYQQQRDDLANSLTLIESLHIGSVAVVLPKAAVDGLIRFGTRFLAHLNDLDAFLPAGGPQAPEFARVLAAFKTGIEIPVTDTPSRCVIEASHA